MAKGKNSYTLPDTNVTIKAGDQILLKPKGQRQKRRVAFVKKIITDGSQTEVVVKLFHRPEETKYAEETFLGKAELFYSKQCTTVIGADIICKCDVLDFKKYVDLITKGERPDGFYTRFVYDPTTESLETGDGEDIAVYCICENPYNPDQFVIRCGTCKNRYHPSCLNISDKVAREIPATENYYCTRCNPQVGGGGEEEEEEGEGER